VGRRQAWLVPPHERFGITVKSVVMSNRFAGGLAVVLGLQPKRAVLNIDPH